MVGSGLATLTRGLALDALLARIAELAERGEPLPEGLRASGLPGAVRVADALDGGADLPDALQGLLSPAWAQVLAGPRPPLAQAALLVREELRLRRERRRLLVGVLAYPAVCVVALAGVATLLRREVEAPLLDAWAWALPAAGLLALLPVAILLLPLRCALRLPLLVAWRIHAARAASYARAALAARWRLDEEGWRRLFGHELGELGPLLAQPGAETHCRRLAEHHRDRARRAAHRCAIAIAVGIQICAGAVVLGAAMEVWGVLLEAVEGVLVEMIG